MPDLSFILLLMPQHPGTHFNSDVIRRAGQFILVTTDLFSSYTTACFIASEKAEDLCLCLITTITPIRHNNSVLVRVDRSTSFQILANKPDPDLKMNRMRVELGESFNKHSNTCVDRRIPEQQYEIRKILPTEKKLSPALISEALYLLIGRSRGNGLSSAEIHFSRNAVTGDNLPICNENLGNEHEATKKKNNIRSAVSKQPHGKPPTPTNAVPGDLVYARDEMSKNHARSPFIVTETFGNKKVLRKVGNILPINPGQRQTIAPKKLIVSDKHLFKPSRKLRIPQVYDPDEHWKDTTEESRTANNPSSQSPSETEYYDSNSRT